MDLTNKPRQKKIFCVSVMRFTVKTIVTNDEYIVVAVFFMIKTKGSRRKQSMCAFFFCHFIHHLTLFSF